VLYEEHEQPQALRLPPTAHPLWQRHNASATSCASGVFVGRRVRANKKNTHATTKRKREEHIASSLIFFLLEDTRQKNMNNYFETRKDNRRTKTKKDERE